MGKEGTMHEKKRYILIGIAILIFLLLYLFPFNMPLQAKSVLAITIFAMILWVSEVIPLHATAFVVAIALVLFGRFSIDSVFSQFFDKVVVLILGGFVMAIAMRKYKLDEYFACKLLGKLYFSSWAVLMGIVGITMFLSMWMSNTAAASLMMPIALVILSRNKEKKGSALGKASVLAVAYGATIGGIGTIIGSTPNVLAQKFLTEKGISFGFIEWGIRGFPFMVLMAIICWIVLLIAFKVKKKRVNIQKHPHPFTPEQKKVALIFFITVLLWITEGIHGIHNSVIAVFPIIFLYVFRLLDTKDFHKVGWDSLVLIGGGIALGMAIDISGLDDILSSFLRFALIEQSYLIILLSMGFLGVMMTSFISNTAASAVLIPIVTALSSILGKDMTTVVVTAAIGVSLDFILPMGTPPTAIAYSTGHVHMKDIIPVGIVLSILGILLLGGVSYWLW